MVNAVRRLALLPKLIVSELSPLRSVAVKTNCVVAELLLMTAKLPPPLPKVIALNVKFLL